MPFNPNWLWLLILPIIGVLLSELCNAMSEQPEPDNPAYAEMQERHLEVLCGFTHWLSRIGAVANPSQNVPAAQGYEDASGHDQSCQTVLPPLNVNIPAPDRYAQYGYGQEQSPRHPDGHGQLVPT